MDKHEQVVIDKENKGFDIFKNQIKVSVIMPCYNVEQYVRECIESILLQTLHDIEIICIDDGSTDGTLGILEEYQEKVDCLKVLQQENQGSGLARNWGIKEAIGEYIAFMDADDFYPSPNTLEKVYTVAKEKGAVICGGSACTYRNGVFSYKGLRKGHTFSEDGWINKEDFPTAYGYWRFIYKSNFLNCENIFFPNYFRNQDPPFFLAAVASAGQVYCMKEVTYVHRREHKQVSYVLKKAIDYAKGIRDSLMISQREGMTIAYLEILNTIHGTPSACMYLFAEEYDEMRRIIHQINEVIDDDASSKAGISLLKEGDELSNYLKSVREEKQQLLERLRKERKVLIFGAGVMGKKVRSFLGKNGIVMEAFVVSDVTKNAANVDGLQVRCIDDYMNIRNDCIVIIATYPAKQDEIKEILRKKGFEKIYPFSLEKFHLFEGRVVH